MLQHQPSTPTPDPARGAFDAAAAHQAFVTTVGTDFAKALRELARLKEEADSEDDDDRQEALDVSREAARDYVLALPIQRPEDVHLKARITVVHCHWADEMQQALLEIAAFGSTDPIEPAEIF